MSIKRIIPIFLVLALSIGFVAWQLNTADEAVAVPANRDISDTVPTSGVEKSPPAKSEADAVAAQDDGAPSSPAEPQEAAVPEFVPPKPMPVTTDAETVAYAMGDPDAPVQIIEFTDYQCPFCQRYAMETMPAVLENLVESGRVFYAVKDLPLDSIHPEARAASVAARCAGEQDAYLPMHDAIFAAQAEWRGTGDEVKGIFAEMAVDLDLDTDAFSTCMAGSDQAQRVQANVEEALSLGANGTPLFFIDGYALSGAQPYELFEMVVELAEKDELDDVIEAQARQAYDAMLAQQAPPQPVAPVEVSLAGAYSIGDPNAPVTIVEYTDYQCPYCARHALQTFAQIEETMVETGDVRYAFKDLPLTSIHPQAMLAAEAARCAGVQEAGHEAFVAMHNMLFEKQKAWSGQANAADLFTEYATEIGLDAEAFATCLQDHEFEPAVLADMQEAMDLGFRGTPAFLINGQPVSGALPFDVFEQVVADLLTEASAETVSDQIES